MKMTTFNEINSCINMQNQKHRYEYAIIKYKLVGTVFFLAFDVNQLLETGGFKDMKKICNTKTQIIVRIPIAVCCNNPQYMI